MIAMVMTLVMVPGVKMLTSSMAAPAESTSLTAKKAAGTVADDRVNAVDLSALISHDGEPYPAADYNGDGTVGAADMAILLSKWTW